MDKGYDFPEVHELLEDYSYIIHIKLRLWLAEAGLLSTVKNDFFGFTDTFLQLSLDISKCHLLGKISAYQK
jgi:hypothetical protein